MCGFCGFIDTQGSNTENLTHSVRAMNQQLVHRGPDDGGHWLDESLGVVLGHRRLAIVDLSPAGHQPMLSTSGRFVIAFNGEIYNFKALRQRLEQQGASFEWRGHSDTEVLLAAIETWGIEQTLQQCVGMFAFALWDRKERCLVLARDRLGEKPLYYGFQNGVFLFGSELKALKAHPAWQGDIDRGALTLFLQYNCVPAPHSIYQGIAKLMPATYIKLAYGNKQCPQPKTYWSFNQVATEGVANPFQGSDNEAITALDTVLKQAVAGQMVADVPLGAFLSGGFDSSLVVALMQAQSSQAIKTFSIGFHEKAYNEAEHAKAVATHLGTEHTELYVSPQQVMAVIPSMANIYDEPFADSSQLPTFLVSQLAKQHVTVSLSGDGGDELFCGYQRYFQAEGLWQRLSRFPTPLRHVLAKFLTLIPVKTWNQLLSILPVLPETLQQGRGGDRLHKIASILAVSTHGDMYKAFLIHWQQAEQVVLAGNNINTVLDDTQQFKDSLLQTMYVDTLSYLSNDILTKVDRAAMAVSLETRIPLLDHRVVEFAWQLPMSMKVRDGGGKWLLRQVLYQYVPQSILDRPKMGFGVPIEEWLREPLRDWAENLLDEQSLTAAGFFNPQAVRKKWQEHLAGQRNWSYHLWDILMFQAWLEND